MQSAGCLSSKQLQFIFSNIPLFAVLNQKLLESLQKTLHALAHVRLWKGSPVHSKFEYKRMKQKLLGLLCFSKIAVLCMHYTPSLLIFFTVLPPPGLLIFIFSLLTKLSSRKTGIFASLSQVYLQQQYTVYSKCRGLQFQMGSQQRPY